MALQPDGNPKGRCGAIEGNLALSADARDRLIAQAAYFRAERRGFAPGHELEDWTAAEREVDQQFSATL